jgi:hypothetical protein
VVAGGDRSNADHLIVAALAAGTTNQEAATAAGVGERTVRRRLDDPAFRRQVSEARAALLEQAIGRMAGATTEAADTLRLLLNAESEHVRHAAAKTLLELASKGIELLDLAERIAALELASEQTAKREKKEGRR